MEEQHGAGLLGPGQLLLLEGETAGVSDIAGGHPAGGEFDGEGSRVADVVYGAEGGQAAGAGA